MQQTTIFLASRFKEFQPLRREIGEQIQRIRNLKARLLNLDDGTVASNPVLTECLRKVDESDIIILLFGEHYGVPAPEQKLSFTHLEYQHAVKRRKRVLAFFIGESFGSPDQGAPDLSRLTGSAAQWAQDILKNHTWGFIDARHSPAELAREIVSKLFNEVLYLLDVRADEVFEDLPENVRDAISGVAGQNEDRAAFRERHRRNLGVEDQHDDNESAEFLSRHPETAAARELSLEATRAIELGEYDLALQLLRRSLERRPLDPAANERLAKFYLALDHDPDPAIVLAERAARLFEADGDPVRAVDAHLLAARGYAKQENFEAAVRAADRGTELVRNDTLAYLAQARYLIRMGKIEPAAQTVKEAYGFRADVLATIYTDPDFKPVRRHLDEHLKKREQELRRAAGQVLTVERRLNVLLHHPEPVAIDLGALTLRQAVQQARSSVERQRQHIARALQDLGDSVRSPQEREQEALDTLASAERAYHLAVITRLSVTATSVSTQTAGPRQSLQLDLDSALADEEQRAASLEFARQQLDAARRPLVPVPEDSIMLAIAQFETESLSKSAQVLPYASLFSVRHGGLTRMGSHDLDRYRNDQEQNRRNNWRSQSRQRELLIDPPPTHWPALGDHARRLYKVHEENRNGQKVLRLSATDAYTVAPS